MKQKTKKRSILQKLPSLPDNPLFSGVVWLLAKPRQKQSSKNKNKHSMHMEIDYGLYETELIVSASSLLVPGRMVRIDQEVMQVLDARKHVDQDQADKKKESHDYENTFIVTVDRARMGSQIAKHTAPCPLYILSTIRQITMKSPVPMSMQEKTGSPQKFWSMNVPPPFAFPVAKMFSLSSPTRLKYSRASSPGLERRVQRLVVLLRLGKLQEDDESLQLRLQKLQDEYESNKEEFAFMQRKLERLQAELKANDKARCPPRQFQRRSRPCWFWVHSGIHHVGGYVG